MCTVTWRQRAGGYEVFCNRDELKSRQPALPPRFAERNGVRYLAPIDADGGGSWIGVNEFGVSLCLVNHYPVSNPSLKREALAINTEQNIPLKGGILDEEKLRSRGLLLTELLGSASLENVATQMKRERMEQYRSFILLAFALHEPFRIFVWNRETLHAQYLNETALPVTSSSYKTESVIASRRQVFAKDVIAEMNNSPERFANFHRSHRPERSAYSVCMHRDEAETVSFTQVCVQEELAELHYLPHAPCATQTEAHAFHLCLSLREEKHEKSRSVNVGSGPSQ